jgi:hypothetical protein
VTLVWPVTGIVASMPVGIAPRSPAFVDSADPDFSRLPSSSSGAGFR